MACQASKRRDLHHLTRRVLLTRTAGLGLASVLAPSAVGAETVLDASTRPTPAATPSRTNTDFSLDQLRVTLPRTATLLDDLGPETGGQLYISRDQRVIANYAFGTTGPGAAITPDSLVPWASATKPTTCLGIMRLADAGVLSIDDPVTTYIPEFGVNGKDAVIVRHLLTHTGHLGGYDGPTVVETFNDTVTKIIQAPLDASRPERARSRGGRPVDATAASAGVPPVPGTDPAYNPAGIWILGEILRRLTDTPFDRLIRTEIFLPCGMTDSWNGMSSEQFLAYGDRIVSGVGRINALQVQEATASQANPAGGAVGPIRELARIYEMMLAGGTIDGSQIVTSATAAEMTTLQATNGGIFTWGLGFNLNSPVPSTDTGTISTPATPSSDDDAVTQSSRYGERASTRTFGHPGATGTLAFADPMFGLAFASIGLPTSIADAVYADLDLA